MGKVSPNDRGTKIAKQKKRLRSSSNKYLKPGALAHQLRYSKPSAAKSCTDLGKKRVALLDADKEKNNVVVIENKSNNTSPTILKPVKFGFGFAMEKSPTILSPTRSETGPFLGAIDVFKQSNLLKTPKTPCPEEGDSESRLEALPMDLLVKIMCHLHHDQLRAVFHVSQKIRKAVIQARQFHFNYTTPDRTRQEMLRTMTPLPTDRWPFVSKRDGKGMLIPSPHTPKAPRHGPRPPSRLKFTEMRQIAAVLFQESAFPSRCLVPSALSQPICKSLASNRALFYEEELCQAVAQNKLR